MAEDKYTRSVQAAVVCFVYCGDKYLLLKRSPAKKIDPNKMNGVGGRVESGETYLDAAIRETEEETGYKAAKDDVKLSGIVHLEGGYAVDWIMCFFKIKVDSRDIPLGNHTEDGDLMWLDKNDVLNSEFELVDDLKYCFEDVMKDDHQVFFLSAILNDQEKVIKSNKSYININ